MRKHSLTLLAAAIFGLAASQASAADLPRKAPAYVPVAPPAPLYVWTGCYIGANVGAAFAHVDVTDVTTGVSGSRSSEASVAGGGQFGCDYQFYNSWVVGIRNMFDGTDIHHTRTFTDPLLFTGAGSVETKVKWFDALTARLGYLVAPNWLIYGQGGAAWTKAEATAFDGFGAQVGSISGNSRTGWTAGAASNGCSCRTGLCSLNTITWDLAREARALQSALPGPAASLVRKQISRMLSWA